VESDEGALAEGCAPEDEARRAVVLVLAIVCNYNGEGKGKELVKTRGRRREQSAMVRRR